MSESFEIPGSWLQLTLGEVIDYGKAEKAEPSQIPADAWILELEDIEKDTSKLLQRLTFAERQSKSTKNRFSEGDVLYGKLRPYLNKVLIADQDGYCTTEILPFKPNSAIDGRFLFYWLKHPAFLNYVEAVSHGLNMPRLGTAAGKQAPLLLAPLNEQKRIADKLDRLLSRVDACRERCDRIPLILKRFRQSVIDTAVLGVMTEDWREDNLSETTSWIDFISAEPIGDFQAAIESANYSIPNGWIWLTPDSIKVDEKHSLSIGPFGSNLVVKDYRDSGVPLVFVREIRSRNFGDEKTKYVSEEKAQELWAHRVEPGDLLITKMGDPPGDTAVFPLDRPISIITADCIRIKPNPEIANTKLLSLFINSSLVKSFIKEITAGVAQQKISLQRFRSMPIPFPPLEEQEEIVRQIEELFAFANRLEARYETARAQIDLLTPALLDKAFQGELVPQDPNDESASILLAQIRTEQENQPTKSRKVSTRKSIMTSLSKEDVQEVIQQLPKNTFSFDELRQKLPGDYDTLKDILFTLLGETDSILTQVFDEESQAMQFIRGSK